MAGTVLTAAFSFGTATFPPSFFFFFSNRRRFCPCFANVSYADVTCHGDICALHPFKGLIFTASVCVNKMAFPERGCGEAPSVGTCSSLVVNGWKCKKQTQKHPKYAY